MIAVTEVTDSAIEYITILGKNIQHDEPEIRPKDGTIIILRLDTPHNSPISAAFNPINMANVTPINVENGIRANEKPYCRTR